MIGLAVADELTRHGAEVIVLEKGLRAGAEASSAAAGILSPHGEAHGPGPLLSLLLAGFQLIPEMAARLQALTHVDLLYKANGMLAVALSDEEEKKLAADIDWQEKAGLRLERVSAAQVKALEPAIDGPVRWGVRWPQMAQIDNTALIEAYCRAIGKQGGIIRTNREVSRFITKGDRVVGVETLSEQITADVVVNCAGSWARFDGGLPFQLPVVPVKGQLLQFKTTSPLVRHVVVSGGAYLVQRSTVRLIAGTTVERAGYDKTVTNSGSRSVLDGITRICSAFGSLKPETAWAGLRPGTPDDMPILGETPLKGLFVAAGHYRNGILLAPLTGRIMGDLILKQKSPMDISPFSILRFQNKGASGAS